MRRRERAGDGEEEGLVMGRSRITIDGCGVEWKENE